MATRKPQSFELACPSCRAVLTIDPELRAVLHHAPPPRSGPASSLDQAMEALRSQQARREAAFQEAASAEKTKDQLLSRKFKDGLKRAKDDPSRPVRPIDLD